jgi:UDP-2,4-diacetamido-2,4,6-trideoxy-beta-L-altropyranose hydrolase
VKIAIRVDASLRLGSGHFMRCLCLADALRAGGGSVVFLSRPLPDHLAKLLHEHGHALASLPAWPDTAGAIEDPWPAPQRTRDLADCGELLHDLQPQLLIVDHYGADLEWERGARTFTDRLVVIDDLLREHDCDILLDSNVYPSGANAYADRVPKGCTRLVGPAYALLREEFAAARAQARIRDGAVHTLLVFMGGMDSGNITSVVMNALARVPTALRPMHTDVVIGAAHPHRVEIAQLCAAASGVTLHPGTREMAALCLAADLAIGAGGSATWERCATGLPTIALCVAENQRQILYNGARCGILYAPDAFPVDASTLSLHLCAVLGNSGLRHHLSRRSLETVDCQGTSRVARVLLQ